jgi:hypothetical protein
VKLFCGGCEQTKFAGLFSESQRKRKQDSQRRCLRCVSERSRQARSKVRPANMGESWSNSNQFFFGRER